MNLDTTNEYLSRINATETVRDRVATIARFYNDLIGLSAFTTFVSETTDDSGQRIYESLWFIDSDRLLILEAHSFLSEQNYDIADLELVRYVKMKWDDFTPGNWSARSRGAVDFSLRDTVAGRWKASGENVQVMYDHVKKFLVPRFHAGDGMS